MAYHIVFLLLRGSGADLIPLTRRFYTHCCSMLYRIFLYHYIFHLQRSECICVRPMIHILLY